MGIVRCPHQGCNLKISVPERYLSNPGATIKCPACKHHFCPAELNEGAVVQSSKPQMASSAQRQDATEIISPHSVEARIQGANTAVGWLVVHSENAPQQTYDLRTGTQVVGRKSLSRECEIMIETLDNCISRNHFRMTVECHAGKYSYLIEDCNSTNGTFIDTKRLKGYERELKRLAPGEQVYIEDGSIIQAGKTKIVLKTYGAATNSADATRIVSSSPINKTIIL